MKAATKKKAGRPSKYTDEIADYICAQMLSGRNLLAICDEDECVPGRTTVYRWLAERPDFGARIVHAREGLADHAASIIIKLAENCTPETANADRVKLAAYQWWAAKLYPKRYSDKLVNEHVGKDGGPIKTEATTIDFAALEPEDRAAIRTALLAAKGTKGT